MDNSQNKKIQPNTLSCISNNALSLALFQFINQMLPALNQFYEARQQSMKGFEIWEELMINSTPIQNWKQFNYLKEAIAIKEVGKVQESIIILICSAHQLSLKLRIKGQQIQKENEAVIELAKRFQTLRFEVEIFNMQNNIQINYQELIQHLFKQIFRLQISQTLSDLLKLTIKQPNINIEEQLVIRIQKMSIKKNQNNTSNTIVDKGSDRNIVLRHIKLRQKQINDSTISNHKNAKNDASMSQNLFKDLTKFKSKYIQKTRTIYHERKNLYTSKIKKQEFFYCKDKFEVSTQRSFNSSHSKKNSNFQRILYRFEDEQLDQNALAGKTPVQNKIFFDKSISLRLEF